jgi:hypothetical protein
VSRAQDIAQWVEAWGRQSGIDLAPDAKGHYSFVADGLPIRLSMESEVSSSMLAALLQDKDVGASPQGMRALLEFVHLGVVSQRCAVSLSDDGRPVLWLWFGWAGLDAAALTNSLNGFVAVAAAAQERLAGTQTVDHSAGRLKSEQLVQADWMSEFGPLSGALRV